MTTPPTLDSTPTSTAHRTEVRKLRPSSWAVALGMIMSALISSSPTTRIDTTTVTAVSTARAMLRPVTGRPVARAYSSSLATAKSHGRSSQVPSTTTTARPAKTHRSAALAVVMAPNRYAVRLAGLPLGDLAMITTPAAMPP